MKQKSLFGEINVYVCGRVFVWHEDSCRMGVGDWSLRKKIGLYTKLNTKAGEVDYVGDRV